MTGILVLFALVLRQLMIISRYDGGEEKALKNNILKIPKKHVEVTLDQRVSTATAQFTQSAT